MHSYVRAKNRKETRLIIIISYVHIKYQTNTIRTKKKKITTKLKSNENLQDNFSLQIIRIKVHHTRIVTA